MTVSRRIIFGAASVVIGGAAGQSAPQAGVPARRLDLRIRFMTQRNGAEVVRGEETVSYDWNDDGTIIFRAASRSFDPKVTRDAVYTLASDYKPLDAYTRIQVDGRYIGAGLFRFEEGFVHSTTYNHEHGDRTGTIKIEGRVGALCSHPVSTDVLMIAAFDHGAGRGRQKLRNAYLSSPDPFGRTGPELTKAHSAMDYVGREMVKTPAGEFETDHYRLFSNEADQEPIEELWSLPGTSVFIQARAGGGYNTRYELVEFRAA